MLACCLEWLLFAIGVNLTVSVLLELKDLADTLLASNDLSRYGKGSWALVTACTDGIGQGFADTLAKQGFNIIQIGRNPQKLSTTANDLKSKYGVQVMNITKDFSACGNNPIEFFSAILKQTEKLDVSIIINNVGTNPDNGDFLSRDFRKILDTLALNLFPIAYLSRLYMPLLMQRPQGGAIVNLSSVRSYKPIKDTVIYSATKSYDYVLSEVCDSEAEVLKKQRKVDILCLMPGYVNTPLTSTRKNKFLEISRYECAEKALKCLGATRNTNGNFKHFITGMLLRLYPLM